MTESTPKFVPGDKVLVNGSLVAEIHTYDEATNVLVYTAGVGGGTDTTYAHISQTRLEHLVQAPVGSDVRPGETTEEFPAVTDEAAEAEEAE